MNKKDFAQVFLLLLLCLLNLSTGAAEISFSDFLESFTEHTNSISHTVLWEIRIPRLLSCLLIGSCLSVCGLYFQNLLRNPLAEPFTMGFSGAASLGVCLGVVFGFGGSFWGPSFLGLLTCLGVAFLSTKIKDKILLSKHSSLVLIGISISFFCSAFVVLIQSFFSPSELQASYHWLIGSFDTYRTSSWYVMLVPVVLLSIYQICYHKDLDRILLGRFSAESLGVNPQKLETKLYFICAIVCGLSVYLAGVIAFVGLIGPQLVKYFYCESLHKKLFYRSLLMGANILVFSDYIALLFSYKAVIPTGGVVSLFGAPFLVYLLLKGGVNG